MNFLLGAFSELWTNFYNKVIRDASSTLKGGIIISLFVLCLLCFAFAMKGKNKENFINNWVAFWFGIAFLLLLVIYVALLKH